MEGDTFIYKIRYDGVNFPPMVQLCRRRRWNGSHPLRKCMCVMECWRETLTWPCCFKEVTITDVTSELLTSKYSSRDRQFLVDDVRIESVTKASTTRLWMSLVGIGVEDDSETRWITKLNNRCSVSTWIYCLWVKRIGISAGPGFNSMSPNNKSLFFDKR